MVGVVGSNPIAPTSFYFLVCFYLIMPIVRLIDGSTKTFAAPVTAAEVAGAIGPGLAKAALAAEVNSQLFDLSYLIDQDVDQFRIITAKDDEGLEILRHSCAHLLAMAVKELYPEAQVTIGPVIEHGFYYDFAFVRAFTPDDLEKIEKRMHALAAKNLPVRHFTMSRQEAVSFFKAKKEFYKVEVIQSIPESETLGFYEQGDFVDLCRGPHIPHTGHIKAFKLTKLAGAYWRGDSANTMLQRIYGTCWPDKKSLAAYLYRIEEADKRDHRKLAKAMDLFHFEEHTPGMVFWHQHGFVLYDLLQSYLRDIFVQNGYQEVRTPQVLAQHLWEKSGHWDKFAEDMFITEAEHKSYAIKPMNCPGHLQIFNQGLKSYRDLPLRLAEFGLVHRNEPSGTLHGLMRARSFTQDDAHIFCTEQQLAEEVKRLIDLLFAVYKDFGFTEIIIKLSTRPEKRVGSDEIWDHSEKALQTVLDEKGLVWKLSPGEGAFYGPKIEFSLKDCLERVWQCGTIQLDFSMPKRLGAIYIAEDNSKKNPVMIHRAILGSLERFIGILIEHYAGRLPLWLAPVQIVILNITDKQHDYCLALRKKFQQAGFRANVDLRNEKISFKIRQHTLSKVPYLVIVGDKEIETDLLAIRTKGNNSSVSLSFNELSKKLQNKIKAKDQVLNI